MSWEGGRGRYINIIGAAKEHDGVSEAGTGVAG
jgi:hypothetical protein